MDIFNYFERAHYNGLKPALLEFTHHQKCTPLLICGIAPLTTLVVKDEVLYRDDKPIGHALDIFDYLSMSATKTFFPAWLGFFSYEFSHYFGKPCHRGPKLFPDAIFQLFERGLLVDDGKIIHHDPLPAYEEQLRPTPINRSRNLTPSLTKHDFVLSLRKIKEQIRLGDVYQVNFSLPFSFAADDADMIPIYQAMRAHNPSPFMGIIHHDNRWLLSGSPERLFSYHENILTTRPIAGTKPRHDQPVLDDKQIEELTICPKENAEHAMLVDLMRNDMNQVCLPASVHIDEDRSVEFYSHVMHLVSSIKGASSAPLRNVFEAIFPGGTITGAPKTSVMTTIANLELSPRGPYTGSLGYVSGGYGCDFNILIRSVFMQQNNAVINAGAGIVIDSDEESEWLEINRKAAAINDILQNKREAKPPRKMRKGAAINNNSTACATHARILFVENNDSFSFNIVDALRIHGASVSVVTRNYKQSDLARSTHVVIGPGPGNPENLPYLLDIIEQACAQEIPLLGICLGHQAIAHYHGARIKKLSLPVHGKPHNVFHYGRGLFLGLCSPLIFVRYHSLAINQAPQQFLVDAYSDDTIMAIRHETKPIFGVQFHPESYLSQSGHTLLANFLAQTRKPD